MNRHPKRTEHEGLKIDIEQIRREYRPSQRSRSYSRTESQGAGRWRLRRS